MELEQKNIDKFSCDYFHKALWINLDFHTINFMSK